MSKYTIGIDLGGTTMTAGLVDENYKIIGKTTWAVSYTHLRAHETD